MVEDTPITADPANRQCHGTTRFSDVDLSDGHTVNFVAAPGDPASLGTFALGAVSESANRPGTVGWTYPVANSATQYLAAGQTVTENFTVTINDGHGGTVTQVVTVTITGTNDAPTITVRGRMRAAR